MFAALSLMRQKQRIGWGVRAKGRVVPKWLFPPRFSNKDRFTSSRPDIVLVTPTSAKTRKQQTTAGGWVLRSGRGQLRETGSTPAALPATSRATNPRQQQPKDFSKPRRDIHLVKIKYCEDSRPQNQLNAAKEQHKDLCIIFQGASVTLHTILLGVSGTIYNNHTLELSKELGLDSQRVKIFCFQASCSFCQLCCQNCPYQTCPFQHHYQLSLKASFRPCLRPY